jgi:hypothetical protein
LITEKLGVRDPGRFLGGTGGTGGTSRVSSPTFNYYIKRFSLDEWVLETNSTANPGTSLNVVGGGCGGSPQFILSYSTRRNCRAIEPTNHAIEWHYALPLPRQDLECILKVIELDQCKLTRLHKLHNVTFCDFYELLARPPERFKRYVERLGYGHLAEDAEIDETHPVRAKICVNGKTVYIPKYAKKNELLKKAISRRSGVCRLADQLYEFAELSEKADYLMCLDLTVPRWATDSKEMDNEREKVKTAFQLFRERLVREFYRFDLGFIANYHPWGSKSLEPYLHVHIAYLNVCLIENGEDIEIVRFKPYYTKEELERIREIWKECLIAVGYRIPEQTKIDLKFKYIPLSDRGRVVHRLSYMSRSPIIDLVRYFILNDREPNIDDEWAKYLLSYENRRHVYGFFRKLSYYIEKLRAKRGKKEQNGEQNGHEKKRYCPICGSNVEYTEPLYFAEWESMFRQGKMIIVFFDPKTRKYKALINAAREECLALELLYSRSPF